jgi:hypothetical protein
MNSFEDSNESYLLMFDNFARINSFQSILKEALPDKNFDPKCYPQQRHRSFPGDPKLQEHLKNYFFLSDFQDFYELYQRYLSESGRLINNADFLKSLYFEQEIKLETTPAYIQFLKEKIKSSISLQEMNQMLAPYQKLNLYSTILKGLSAILCICMILWLSPIIPMTSLIGVSILGILSLSTFLLAWHLDQQHLYSMQVIQEIKSCHLNACK